MGEIWEKYKNNLDPKEVMKYNLLPDLFGNRFNELKIDLTEMSKQKFLSEAQKCEEADKKE